ncbi:MAG: methyltransferase domain-containing protein [Candidatus Geothermincolia bacterium]
MIRSTLATILTCPRCDELLDMPLSCPACGAMYDQRGGMPILLAEPLRGLKSEESEHYSSQVEDYLRLHDAWKNSPFYRRYHQDFLKPLLALPGGARVLEVGAGLGNDGLELLRAGLKVIETDISAVELACARRAHHEAGFGEQSLHIVADSERLPFAGDAFDGLLMVACLHHFPHPAVALAEALRVLKPGGTLVIGTEPNSWQFKTVYPLARVLLNTWARLGGRAGSVAASAGDEATRGFSGAALECLLQQAGFVRVRLIPAGFLSAAVFSVMSEISNFAGHPVPLFGVERMMLPLDRALAKMPVVRRFPWHWTALAYKPDSSS